MSAVTTPGSWKCEVFTENEWVGNAMRFPTHEAAEQYGRDLLMRWMTPSDYRVVPSDDPPNQ